MKKINKGTIIFIALLGIFILSLFFPSYVPSKNIDPGSPLENFKTGDVLLQKLDLNSYNTKDFVLRSATYFYTIPHVNFDIKLLNNNKEVLAQKNYDFNDFIDQSYIYFEIPKGITNLNNVYYLEIDFNDATSNLPLSFYSGNYNSSNFNLTINENISKMNKQW